MLSSAHARCTPPPLVAPADPRITDYDTLLANIADLKAGRPAQVSPGRTRSAARRLP